MTPRAVERRQSREQPLGAASDLGGRERAVGDDVGDSAAGDEFLDHDRVGGEEDLFYAGNEGAVRLFERFEESSLVLAVDAAHVSAAVKRAKDLVNAAKLGLA